MKTLIASLLLISGLLCYAAPTNQFPYVLIQEASPAPGHTTLSPSQINITAPVLPGIGFHMTAFGPYNDSLLYSGSGGGAAFIFSTNVNVTGDLLVTSNLTVVGTTTLSTNIVLSVTNWTTNAFFATFATNADQAISATYAGTATNWAAAYSVPTTNGPSAEGTTVDMDIPYMDSNFDGPRELFLTNVSTNKIQSVVVMLTANSGVGLGHNVYMSDPWIHTEGTWNLKNKSIVSIFVHPAGVGDGTAWTNAICLPLW